MSIRRRRPLGMIAGMTNLECRMSKRASNASETAERSEPAKRRASDGAGESEGRRPSDNL